MKKSVPLWKVILVGIALGVFGWFISDYSSESKSEKISEKIAEADRQIQRAAEVHETLERREFLLQVIARHGLPDEIVAGWIANSSFSNTSVEAESIRRGLPVIDDWRFVVLAYVERTAQTLGKAIGA